MSRRLPPQAMLCKRRFLIIFKMYRRMTEPEGVMCIWVDEQNFTGGITW